MCVRERGCLWAGHPNTRSWRDPGAEVTAVGRERAYGGKILTRKAPKEHQAAVEMGGRTGSEEGDVFPKRSAPQERKEV